jgi:hypothetical protein
MEPKEKELVVIGSCTPPDESPSNATSSEDENEKEVGGEASTISRKRVGITRPKKPASESSLKQITLKFCRLVQVSLPRGNSFFILLGNGMFSTHILHRTQPLLLEFEIRRNRLEPCRYTIESFQTTNLRYYQCSGRDWVYL